MQKQAIHLFVFSFMCFIAVLIFGSILGPLKKTFSDPKVMRNINLFHSHFDQLCWLGSAAIGCIFGALNNRFHGSERVLKVFTVSYMLGTLLFSLGFLLRASGIILHAGLIENTFSAGVISFGGLLIVIAAVCALYIAFCITRRNIS